MPQLLEFAHEISMRKNRDILIGLDPISIFDPFAPWLDPEKNKDRAKLLSLLNTNSVPWVMCELKREGLIIAAYSGAIYIMCRWILTATGIGRSVSLWSLRTRHLVSNVFTCVYWRATRRRDGRQAARQDGGRKTGRRRLPEKGDHLDQTGGGC